MREEQFFEVTTAALAEVGITDPAFSPGWYYHGENDISGLSDVFADSYTRPHGSPVRDNIIGPFASIENNQK